MTNKRRLLAAALAAVIGAASMPAYAQVLGNSARGAAKGAMIGAVAGDAGKGAAAGALGGALLGGARRRR
jgi:hypothetical protein